MDILSSRRRKLLQRWLILIKLTDGTKIALVTGIYNESSAHHYNWSLASRLKHLLLRLCNLFQSKTPPCNMVNTVLLKCNKIQVKCYFWEKLSTALLLPCSQLKSELYIRAFFHTSTLVTVFAVRVGEHNFIVLTYLLTYLLCDQASLSVCLCAASRKKYAWIFTKLFTKCSPGFGPVLS